MSHKPTPRILIAALAFTAPIRKPADFGSRCRLAAPLGRAMRGQEGRVIYLERAERR